MTEWHIETDYIALAIFLSLFVKTRLNRPRDMESKAFSIITLLGCIGILIDTICTQQMNHPRSWLLYESSMILFTLIMPLLGYLWDMYILLMLPRDDRRTHRTLIFLLVPYILYGVVCLSSPVTGWMFTLSYSMVYARGPLFVPLGYGACFFYLLAGLCIVARYYKYIVPKYHIGLLLLFSLANIFSFIAQGLFPGQLIVEACYALVFLACDIVIEDRRRREMELAAEKTNKALADALQRQAYVAKHDSLTGMLNRTATFDACRALLDAHPDLPFDMIHVDIRRFRLFNAFYGAKDGDELLCSLAGRIDALAREHECSVSGRIEGDVFCTLLPRSAAKSDAHTAHMIEFLRTYRDDFVLEPAIGVYEITDRSMTVEAMFTRASIAAKENKEHQKMYRSVFSPRQEQLLMQEQSIVNEMYTAIANEQFQVYIQPKYALKSASFHGGEALVRWERPGQRTILPAAFIPIFEKNGFIEELDKYMWEHVCRLLRAWLDAGCHPAPISVNVSRISMYGSKTVRYLKALVARYRIPAGLLELELTESAYMDDPEEMKRQLIELHEAGFHILMDDFGSGYSSLNTLKEFSIDVLKVDMNFLPKGENVKRAEIILAAVLRMAHWLGLDVIMEGVETKSELTFLRGMGCDYIQGYYFARPMPAAEYQEKYLVADKPGQTRCALPDPARALSARAPDNDEILVIEDDEMSCNIVAGILKDRNLRMFHNAEDAFAYLQENFLRVGLILVDNFLPGMSGLEFLECCKQEALLQKIPKIFMTSDDRVQTRVHAIQLNLVDFLSKPLNAQVLTACVQRWMRVNTNITLNSIQSTLDFLNEPTAVFQYHGRSAYLEFSNSAFMQMLGYTEALVYGKTYDELLERVIHPEDRQIVCDMLASLPVAGVCHAVHRIRNGATGQYLWVQVRGRLVDDSNGQIGYFTFADITAQQSLMEREQLVAKCNARLAADDNFGAAILYSFQILQSYYGASRVYIFEFDWKTQRMSNTYELAAPGVTEEKDNLQNLPMSITAHWIERFKKNKSVFIDDLSLLKDDPVRGSEYDILAPQGIRSLMVVPIYYAETLYGYIGVDDPTLHGRDKKFLVDLTYSLSHVIHVNHLTESLHALSYTDSLTGLNNRNAYDRTFDGLQTSGTKSVGVLFADINGLKQVNDRLGHKEGDRYIQNAANALRAHFGGENVFRISGDEFVVLMPGCTEAALKESFAAFRRTRAESGDESLSAGIAFGCDLSALSRLVAQAERNMYEMKKEYHTKHPDRRAGGAQ